MSRHHLLQRQIQRFLGTLAEQAELAPFLAAVDEAYRQADDDRRLLERSLDLTSQELIQRYQQAQAQLAELRQAQAALEYSLATLNATLESTEEGVLVMAKDGRIVQANHQAHELFGLPPGSLLGQSSRQTMLRVLRRAADPGAEGQILRSLLADPGETREGTLRLSDERQLSFYTAPQRMNASIIGRVWSFRDITEQCRTEALIRHQANHDALTGLPNRYLFQDRLEHALALARSQRRGLAVLFADLDNFKVINDTAGHRVGDQLLQHAALRLKGCLRPTDTLARLGGDEFVVLMEGVNGAWQAKALGEALLVALARPAHIGRKPYNLRASIGIALFPDDAGDPETLIAHADLAMYEAKARGKQSVHLFQGELGDSLVRRVELEAALHGALERGELQLAFQPKFALADGRMVGAEVLLRWQVMAGDWVPPSEFIPIAEHSKLIVRIGDWVLRQALAFLADTSLPEDFSLAVNLSARQLTEPELPERLARMLAEAGVAPERLELEVTETMVMENRSLAIASLEALRRLGVRIAIDDFGTGYSSLNYLRLLPIDVLKLDRSFIQDLHETTENRAIVQAVMALAQTLDLVVVAEGVENEDTAALLRHFDCAYAQGFLYARPMLTGDFRTWLAQPSRD